LYGSLTESDWASDFLEQISLATRSRSAAVVTTDVAKRLDTLPAWYGAEAASAAAYEGTYGGQNPWRGPSGPVAQHAGVVLVSDDVLPLSDLRRTPFYTDFLRPMDVGHGAGLIGLRTQKEAASLPLLRGERRGVYRGDELALLRLMAPHWVHACRLRSRLGLLTDAERSLSEVLDRLTLGVFLLDASGTLVRNNAAGEGMLSRGDLIVLRRGRVAAVGAADGRSMDAAVQAALSAPTGAGGSLGVAIPLRDRAGHVVAHAGIHAVPGGPHGARAVVLVQTLEGNGSAAALLRRALRDGFDLTEREADLCAALDAGATIAEAAGKIGISVEGARTRLKSIFHKTGAHGQEALARFLAALRTIAGNADTGPCEFEGKHTQSQSSF